MEIRSEIIIPKQFRQTEETTQTDFFAPELVQYRTGNDFFPKRPRISRGNHCQPSVGLRRQAASRSRKKQGERRPYLSAESCTHSAAGNSRSDSHRPKPSAMERDPVRPAAERTPNGQEGGTRRAARQRARANSCAWL